MEKYIEVLPYFIFSCSIGILASLMFGTSNKKITRLRIVREIFGSLWISSIAYFLLQQFFHLDSGVTYGICSIVSFLNSKIINFLKKDLIESLFKGILDRVKALASPKSEE